MALAVAYTKSEGGSWIAIPDRGYLQNPKALLFDNGMIFDYVLDGMFMDPWRKLQGRPKIRIKAPSVAA